ncbi:MAG TPA: hypothetical protein VK067_09925 [Pseudogracilibacillus sp.]|nr:hypothetical protein [Pseudogracilibacillus sp.]
MVLYEDNSEEKTKEIIARTPQEARKKLRKICGQNIEIKSVRSPK